MGGAAVGLGPGVGGIVSAAVGVEQRRFRGEFLIAHRIATASDPVQDAFVRASLTWGGLFGCWAPRTRSLSFPLCVGIAAGVSVARGEGALGNAQGAVTQPWVGVPLRAGLRWTIARSLALALDAMGVWSAVRPTYVAADGAALVPLFQESPVGGVFTAGFELRFP